MEKMTDNAEQRRVEARGNAWLDEVAALKGSLRHLRVRRAETQPA